MTKRKLLTYKSIPSFSSEHFRYAHHEVSTTSKQLLKGIKPLGFLADSAFWLQMTEQKHPSIKFHYVSDF